MAKKKKKQTKGKKKKKKSQASSNEFVRKYLFWVLSSAALVAGVVCWIMSTSSLKGEYAKNKRTIESQFTTVGGILSKSDDQLDNAGTIKLRTDASQELTQKAYKSWQSQFDKQKKDTLIWPKALGDEFITLVEKLPAVEQIKDGSVHEIPRTMREDYRNYIENEIKKLPDIVGDTWTIGVKAAVLGGKKKSDRKALCLWNDQPSAFQRLRVDKTPTTRGTLYKQEDLWVYQALLKIIDKTNKDANVTSKVFRQCALAQILSKERIMSGSVSGKNNVPT